MKNALSYVDMPRASALVPYRCRTRESLPRSLTYMQYGTRHIVEVMVEGGHSFSKIMLTGGLAKNELFVRTHADATGMFGSVFSNSQHARQRGCDALSSQETISSPIAPIASENLTANNKQGCQCACAMSPTPSPWARLSSGRTLQAPPILCRCAVSSRTVRRGVGGGGELAKRACITSTVSRVTKCSMVPTTVMIRPK